MIGFTIPESRAESWPVGTVVPLTVVRGSLPGRMGDHGTSSAAFQAAEQRIAALGDPLQ